MSRYYYDKKTEVEDLLKIDIYWLKKNGYLDSFKSGTIQWGHSWSDTKSTVGVVCVTLQEPPYIEFQYQQTDFETGEKVPFKYCAELTTTDCNYGGKRYWFICPLSIRGSPCNKRVGALYKGGDHFGCRHCYKLTYRSRNRTNNPLFRVIEIGDEIERARAEMTTPFYNGKPTRKFKRIMKLHEKIGGYTPLLDLD